MIYVCDWMTFIIRKCLLSLKYWIHTPPERGLVGSFQTLQHSMKSIQQILCFPALQKPTSQQMDGAACEL